MDILEMKLKALSPIAITKRVFGPLYETELFIPAWTMWYNFVKLYALKENLNYHNAEEVLKNIKLTNFYILEGGDIAVPFKIDDNDNISFDKRKYIGSEFKTAIDPLSNTSLFGALYEREFIKKRDFVGWIKTENQGLKEFFKSLKDQICFIGADKNTGFGKVKIEEVLESPSVNGPRANKIKYYLLNRADLRNHLIPPEFTNKEELCFPLTLRRWDDKKGVGMKVEYIENIQQREP